MALTTIKQPVCGHQAPPVSTVYVTRDGLCHARCGQLMALVGRKAGMEAHFHCRECHEITVIPDYAFSRVPVVE